MDAQDFEPMVDTTWIACSVATDKHRLLVLTPSLLHLKTFASSSLRRNVLARPKQLQ